MGRPVPRAVLTDIEGTTSRIAFVREVLFPFARRGLPTLVRERATDPQVATELAEVDRLAPGRDRLDALLEWMDQDAKVTPLKALQGMLWHDGYASGAIRGDVYLDVAPALRAWSACGLKLFVYSSGSVEAQRLIFGHSIAGDLTPLFQGFFDTRTGFKREAGSYRRIARESRIDPAAMLFLSDVGPELDAAAGAGLLTCQLVRPDDGAIPTDRHPVASDFHEVAAIFGLPTG